MNKRSYETLLYLVTSSAVNKLIEMHNWTEDEAIKNLLVQNFIHI